MAKIMNRRRNTMRRAKMLLHFSNWMRKVPKSVMRNGRMVARLYMAIWVLLTTRRLQGTHHRKGNNKK